MMANPSMHVYCYALVTIFVFFLPAAVYAQSEISVDVEMDEYSLGDHIVFTLSENLSDTISFKGLIYGIVSAALIALAISLVLVAISKISRKK